MLENSPCNIEGLGFHPFLKSWCLFIPPYPLAGTMKSLLPTWPCFTLQDESALMSRDPFTFYHVAFKILT